MHKPADFSIMAGFLALACILQAIGLARYVGRLPDDWVGIGLYAATVVAFCIAAIGFIIQRRREKRKD